MADISRIIKAIDEFLEKNNKKLTTPVEINPYLAKKKLLKDSSSRPGLPVRELLRQKKIPQAFQDGRNWFIPHSGLNQRKESSIQTNTKKEKASTQLTTSHKTHKLAPIGYLILALLKQKYKQEAVCIYEYKPEWLLSYPTKELIEKRDEIAKIYTALTEGKFSLMDKYEELSQKKRIQKQSFDIWIGAPYNFALEFDEKQHFNQFRYISLDYYDKIKTKFPVNIYKKLNEGMVIKPGKSGFTKLKSYDPLFPALLKVEYQDNRIRQRAFRDFLKDLFPIENGFNPTLRIPYHVTNKNINNFTKSDLKKVEDYIEEYDLI